MHTPRRPVLSEGLLLPEADVSSALPPASRESKLLTSWASVSARVKWARRAGVTAVSGGACSAAPSAQGAPGTAAGVAAASSQPRAGRRCRVPSPRPAVPLGRGPDLSVRLGFAEASPGSLGWARSWWGAVLAGWGPQQGWGQAGQTRHAPF